MENMGRIIEFVVIGGYLIILIAIAAVLKNFNKNISDYFRNGCQGTWWLVGMSVFMTSFSAWTFTGASGVAFKHGWSVMFIFLGNSFGLFLNALFLAPWFRQLRAISFPEVIEKRYGLTTQQFYAWCSFALSIISSAIQLYGLAIFTSAVFDFDVQTVIYIIGGIVLLYSLVGGSWAIMATDFIQSLILIPMTLLITVLCLKEFGGIGNFFQALTDSNLTEEYKLIKSQGAVAETIDYTIYWVMGIFIYTTVTHNSLGSAVKYFAVKDGREARRAAGLACVLTLLGSFVWFVPPMTARLLFEQDVTAMELSKPAEAAYAVVSLKLLPLGMSGLMVVAMLAATMSSMDTGLNRNAAIFTRDIYPFICRQLRIEPLKDRKLMKLGEFFTLLLGIIIISTAINLSQLKNVGVFELMQMLFAIINTPMAVPLLLGLFIRKTPRWAAIFSICIAAIPSAMGYYSGRDLEYGFLSSILEEKWKWHAQICANLGVGVAAYLFTRLFWGTASKRYEQEVDQFFTTMRTPVDFEKEVGESKDSRQLKVIGTFCAVVGLGIFALMLLPNPMIGRLSILFVASVVAGIGSFMYLSGVKRAKRM